MIEKAKRLGKAYLMSWGVLLWSSVCICIGAAWMYAAIAAVLRAQGINL
jgi:hypothetical protein